MPAPWSGRRRRRARGHDAAPSSSRSQREVEQRAHRAGALAPLAEGGEVVLARAARSAARSSARRRAAAGTAAPRVGAAGPPAPGGRRPGRRSAATAPRTARRSPAGRAATAPARATSSGSTPGEPAQEAGRGPVAVERRLRDVDVADLVAGVHPGVRTAGHGRARRLEAQHRGQRVLHDVLHRAEPGLDGPPREAGAVVARGRAGADEPAVPRGGDDGPRSRLGSESVRTRPPWRRPRRPRALEASRLGRLGVANHTSATVRS